MSSEYLSFFKKRLIKNTLILPDSFCVDFHFKVRVDTTPTALPVEESFVEKEVEKRFPLSSTTAKLLVEAKAQVDLKLPPFLSGDEIALIDAKGS